MLFQLRRYQGVRAGLVDSVIVRKVQHGAANEQLRVAAGVSARQRARCEIRQRCADERSEVVCHAVAHRRAGAPASHPFLGCR